MRKTPIYALIIGLLFMGAGCLGGKSIQIQPVTLDYWRAEDTKDAMSELIESYQKIHPNIEIVQKTLRAEDYEEALLEALAEGRGPDMFSIPNAWMRGWQAKLLPMPEEIAIPTRVVNEKQQIVAVNLPTEVPGIGKMIKDYVETVPDDVILPSIPENEKDPPEDLIYGLPLTLDTPVLFYNTDLLAKANIEGPPGTWRELQQQTEQLTVLNPDGSIKQSGAALGLAENVLYYTDILTTLMMQNGAEMANDAGYPRFDRYTPETQHNPYTPGAEALIFYQSFSVENAKNYSWNASMPTSLDAFIAGKTAFFFGFPTDVQVIKDRAPKLNYEITNMPLITSARKFYTANYPVEVVSKDTEHPNEAWDFLIFISQPEQASAYLSAVKRPTALRSLVSQQVADPEIEVFAKQVLTARSWYTGKDYPEAEEIFANMTNTRPDPVTLKPSYMNIVGEAAKKVTQTLY